MTRGHAEQDTPHTNYVIAATGDGARMIAAALRSGGQTRTEEEDAMDAWKVMTEHERRAYHVWRVTFTPSLRNDGTGFTRVEQLTDGIELR